MPRVSKWHGKALDFHMANHGTSPGPGKLKIMLGTCACKPKIPGE